MRIGIDFDNTLADYTGVFHAVASALGWIDAEVDHSKQAVKRHFLDADREHVWTELQGMVYGREIFRAKPYAGAQTTIESWAAQGHEIFVISHKTRHPVIGEAVNLHDSAMNWLKMTGLVGESPHPINDSRVHFAQTRQQKVQKIAELNLDAFVDDLPEVFAEPGFPPSTKKILFDPGRHHADGEGGAKVTASWSEIQQAITTL